MPPALTALLDPAVQAQPFLLTRRGMAGYVRRGDEVAAVRDNLEIEHTRFGDRLRLQIAADDAVEAHLVPPTLASPQRGGGRRTPRRYHTRATPIASCAIPAPTRPSSTPRR